MRPTPWLSLLSLRPETKKLSRARVHGHLSAHRTRVVQNLSTREERANLYLALCGAGWGEGIYQIGAARAFSVARAWPR